MIYNIENITENTFYQIRDAYEEGMKDFQFEIDSTGGSLDAAFRIYDLLRSDPECKVSANVSGNCYSAATVILLTAPAERRTASANSSFLIHSPLMPVMQDINKRSADQLKSDIDAAYNQLQSIYIDRTSVSNKEILDYYMDAERLFYADEALKLGFISRKNIYYNIDKNNHMSRIKNLITSILNQLKNETYVTKDGVTFEAMSLEVGVPVEGLQDGVYEIDPTGEVITVEQGIIVDVILPTAEPEPAVEDVNKVDEPLKGESKNEEQVEEPQTEEVKQEVLQTSLETAEEVSEAVSEEEIKQIVEEAIQELKVELENKYQPMCKLVNELGGIDRLKALKNSKSEAKNFKSEKPAEKKKLSLEELMAKVRK